MSLVSKYRVWCETEGKYVYTWSEEEPTVCPNNNTHTIDTDLTSVEEETNTDQVELINMSMTPEGVLRAAPQSCSPGYYLCSRDFLVRTSIVGDDSFEDLYVDPNDNIRKSWGEMTAYSPNARSAYKLVDGVYVEVDDQADADANATMSIWQYQPLSRITGEPIKIEIIGGCFDVDDNLVEPKLDHQMYIVLAPDIPLSMGGQHPFFDGYLKPFEGGTKQCMNSLASGLDPAVSPAAAIVRLWCYYPAGAKQNHIVRFTTYRQLGC